MEFNKYQHIEAFGRTEVEGIEEGTCHIFPKLDGTNASVWMDKGELQFGSRNRHISLEKDNAGFMEEMQDHEGLKKFLRFHDDATIYGEWLVPHSLKDYQDDSWRRFYVFDVFKDGEYLRYDLVKIYCEMCDLDFIPCQAIIQNPTEEQLRFQMDKANFLMKDGHKGEGIVIKNYNYKNKYGRVTWAKMVSNDFKLKNLKEFGPTEMKGKSLVEQKIIDEYLTQSMVDKVYAKIINIAGEGDHVIPQLLSICFYDLIREESWDFLKKHKFPIVDYKLLQRKCTYKIKQLKTDIF